jgi:tetratricopeptide (TPR) repeat protein
MLNRRQALLAGLTADGLSVVEREKALAEVERLGVSTFKPNEAEAHLIIASGWWRLGKEQPEEEWLTKTLPKAKSAFQQLIRLTPEEARGYERLALLLEENAALFVAKLPAEYLARFLPPAVNPWRDAPPGAAPPPNPEERRIAAEAVKALEEWRQLRRAQMEKTVSTPEEIRFFSGEIVRRMRLAAALKNTEGERRTILGRTIKDDLAKVPSEIEADDDAEAALQRARLLADLGQWAEALPILTRHAGRLEPALREEIARLNGVPRLFDPFPHANAAPRARVGLISVSIDPAGALAPPKADAVSATLDGRPMTNGLFAGTQLCFPPASLPLAHGKHQVEFTLKTTGGEQKLTTAFTVDKQGPEIVAETSAVEPLPPGKPTWKIQISDPDSGPALDTVEVHLKTDRKSSPRSPIVDKPLVVGGRYALTMSELNVKKGDVLLGESFQVVSPAELRQGTYVLTVRCADRLGNQAEFKRAWTVK